MNQLFEKTIIFVVFGALLLIFVMIYVPTKGPDYCIKNLKKTFPNLDENLIQIDSLYTRTLNDHWITALVYQPIDIEKDEVTFVCTFSSTNYVFNYYRSYQGNKINKLKNISTSNQNPITWLQ